MAFIDFTFIFQVFVLLNPLASMPFLISAFKKRINVRIIAIKSVITAFVIAIIITLFGDFLFNMFGIGLDSLRIAGGIILLMLGINMVTPSKKESGDSGSIDDLITIIATPMLTGPGTISFITLKTYEFGKFFMVFNLILAFIFLAIVFVTLAIFIDKINMKVVDITSRVLGLFLTAVAIEMIAKGIHGFVMLWIVA